MNILGPTTNDDFIANYWQQKPLLIRQAIPAAQLREQDLIDGDELAGLALEEDVESRIIRCDNKLKNWQCEDGPFAEDYFSALPASHWTLLVQGVDQHVPQIAALLKHFNFLPRWRLDDIMISYAVNGGGVGPHFDHYDVFLLQLEGKRRWQLGQRCDQHTPLQHDAPLKLLAQFDQQDEFELDAGDMLYLPGGVAHWGTALDDSCITCSIGYRSPSQRNLVMHAMEDLQDTLPDLPGYRDSVASVDADPFRINAAAIAQAQIMWDSIEPEFIVQALVNALGAQVTEPRQAELIANEQMLETQDLVSHLATASNIHLQHHPSSRFAYFARDGQSLLFVDGQSYKVSAAMAKGVCHCHLDKQALHNDSDRAVLLGLIEQGSVSIQ